MEMEMEILCVGTSPADPQEQAGDKHPTPITPHHLGPFN